MCVWESNEIKLDSIDKFTSNNARNRYWYDLFNNLENDKESVQDFVNKFEDIYYISINSLNFDWYKDYPLIDKIIEQYQHTTEWRPMEIMFFKYKALSLEQKQAAKEYLQKTYWDWAQLDETEYWYVVWYFWWSLWRTNSYYMNEVMKIYPVKKLVK